jgi:hypothetical protein
MSFLRRKTEAAVKAIQALHGPSMYRKEAKNGGVVSNSGAWTDKLAHPANMGRYDTLNSKPEIHVAIELLTHMIAPSIYVQMPEFDDQGKEIDPKHKNVKVVEKWIRDTRFKTKYQQIVRTKIGKGFCPVEIQSDKTIKLLPPESFYIWRDKFGRVYRYTQEINNQEVARWEKNSFAESFKQIEKFYTQQEREEVKKVTEGVIAGKFEDIVLFIHNEDVTHPYGVAISDSIADLIECRDQLNVDMPKIIHRFSSPTMTVISTEDVSQIKTAIENKEVDEAVFIGNAPQDGLKIEFHEPDARVKFTEYIELINFQIAEELHAPLILLLKNATEASATKMLESVDRNNQSEQDENAETIEQKIFTRLCSAPIPEFLHGAPDSVLKDVSLTDIGTLTDKSISKKQAQDLIRKKGIDLIEDEEWLNKKPDPILQAPTGPDGKPLLNKDKINQADLSLRTVKDAFDNGKILISEALKEGDRIIKVYVDKARNEAASQARSVGKELAPESVQHFELIKQSMFSQFRDSLLPVGLKTECVNA